ncbi:rhodanese-like domain-containing protein [Acaryochloris sp. CCMEE 5410]|uniref:rhodanese-like domain-containing protein n=1 Tax=Acaryochloris sp. CCMEE 5410 TaxID=310037 RepID=UPI0021D19616|nr:rhodanese-like domain-containing protein [Acaryochloris sp. CCMEE 5410]
MTFAMHNLKEIDALTLKQWMDRNEVLLIDVSKPQEFEKSHIPGAKLIPIDKFDPATVLVSRGKGLSFSVNLATVRPRLHIKCCRQDLAMLTIFKAV